MSSVCIATCATDARIPARATYVNLYKWPESEAEFVKSVGKTAAATTGRRGGGHRRVIDNISSRKMYLRSYSFSKKESVPVRTGKCLGRVKERVAYRGSSSSSKKRKRSRRGSGGGIVVGRRSFVVIRKLKEFTCAAFFTLFQKLLSCTATVDVIDAREGICDELLLVEEKVMKS
ncbi:hypothetical protein RJ641_028279 [Dillenia turbinata]|uniref:Uncharacterized protein n=1 Tax=Dillenia turbinata TaxID=194707 RepID=A0AAN8ZMH3_9MAGN